MSHREQVVNKYLVFIYNHEDSVQNINNSLCFHGLRYKVLMTFRVI